MAELSQKLVRADGTLAAALDEAGELRAALRAEERKAHEAQVTRAP